MKSGLHFLLSNFVSLLIFFLQPEWKWNWYGSTQEEEKLPNYMKLVQRFVYLLAEVGNNDDDDKQ